MFARKINVKILSNIEAKTVSMFIFAQDIKMTNWVWTWNVFIEVAWYQKIIEYDLEWYYGLENVIKCANLWK